MALENIVDQLLDTPAVRALVGRRWALEQIDEQGYPCITYMVVTDRSDPTVAFQKERNPTRFDSRVQVNVHGKTRAQVLEVRAAVEAALDKRVQLTVAGHRLLASRLLQRGNMPRDDSLGVYTQSIDFRLRYY